MIAITTPRDSDHYFSQLLRLKDPITGKPLFNVVRLGEPCEDCKLGEQPWMCTHRQEDPHWKSRSKSKKFEQVYTLHGQEHVHLREQMGMDADDVKRVFNGEMLEILDKPRIWKADRVPEIVWMGADPSGHGKSHYAMVAGYFEEDNFIVSITLLYLYLCMCLWLFLRFVNCEHCDGKMASSLVLLPKT